MPTTEKSILVVEDDPAALLFLERSLRSFGYRVVVATGSQTALERIAEFQPDGMILDIHLPGMGGPQLLQSLRLPDTRHAPAIAITGDPEIREAEVIANGFLALLHKPFSPQQLKEAVATFIG